MQRLDGLWRIPTVQRLGNFARFSNAQSPAVQNISFQAWTKTVGCELVTIEPSSTSFVAVIKPKMNKHK